MGSRLGKLFLFIVIIAVAIAIAVMLTISKKPPEKAPVEEKAFLVDVIPAQYQDLNYVVQSQGTIEPKFETRLSSQVSGRIANISSVFIEGGLFKQGDVLVELESYDYETDFKLAQAELAKAEAALEEEIARGKVAEQEWRSVKSGPIPELGLRKPQLAKEKANLVAAQAQLERAERNLQRTRITAPYDGIVKQKSVELGQYVTTGMELGVIYNTDVAQVRMPLSDNDLAYLSLNSDSPPDVEFSAFVAGKQATWKGKLTRDEGVLDQSRRVIYAVAEIIDPYLRKSGHNGVPLKFGRFVQAQITGHFAQNIVVLPRGVLRLDGSILIADSDNKIEIRGIDVQRADEDFVYINAGLQPGEKIITSAVPNPYNGMHIRYSNQPADIIEQDKEGHSDTAIVTAGEH